jgi:hypothetical protein
MLFLGGGDGCYVPSKNEYPVYTSQYELNVNL